MFLIRLTQALNSAGINYALVGGHAVALHGAVRGTVDIDLVIELNAEAYEGTERVLASLGLTSRLPITGRDVFSFREEYILKRNLVAWSFCNPNDPTQVVDVIITQDLSRLRTKEVKLGAVVISIVAKDDLIAMKQKSGRPQDLADVEALKKL